jgi:hypothetical protein
MLASLLRPPASVNPKRYRFGHGEATTHATLLNLSGDPFAYARTRITFGYALRQLLPDMSSDLPLLWASMFMSSSLRP